MRPKGREDRGHTRPGNIIDNRPARRIGNPRLPRPHHLVAIKMQRDTAKQTQFPARTISHRPMAIGAAPCCKPFKVFEKAPPTIGPKRNLAGMALPCILRCGTDDPPLPRFRVRGRNIQPNRLDNRGQQKVDPARASLCESSFCACPAASKGR